MNKTVILTDKSKSLLIFNIFHLNCIWMLLGQSGHFLFVVQLKFLAWLCHHSTWNIVWNVFLKVNRHYKSFDQGNFSWLFLHFFESCRNFCSTLYQTQHQLIQDWWKLFSFTCPAMWSILPGCCKMHSYCFSSLFWCLHFAEPWLAMLNCLGWFYFSCFLFLQDKLDSV